MFGKKGRTIGLILYTTPSLFWEYHYTSLVVSARAFKYDLNIPMNGYNSVCVCVLRENNVPRFGKRVKCAFPQTNLPWPNSTLWFFIKYICAIAQKKFSPFAAVSCSIWSYFLICNRFNTSIFVTDNILCEKIDESIFYIGTQLHG